jgi:hypothetical protein
LRERVSHQRRGCTFFHIAQDVVDLASFRLIEGWESQEALDSQFASKPFQKLLHETLQLRIMDRHADAIFFLAVTKPAMPSAWTPPTLSTGLPVWKRPEWGRSLWPSKVAE